MSAQKSMDKWLLPLAGLVVFTVIAFGIYRGWSSS